MKEYTTFMLIIISILAIANFYVTITNKQNDDRFFKSVEDIMKNKALSSDTKVETLIQIAKNDESPAGKASYKFINLIKEMQDG